jgi:hypothetical protein
VRAHISESVFGAAMVIVALAVVSSVASAVVDDDDHGEKCPTSDLIWPDASSVSLPPPLLVERNPVLCLLAKRVYVAVARHHRLLCIVRSSVAWLCGAFVVFFLFLRDHAVAPILRGILNFDIYAASDSGSSNNNNGGAASCQNDNKAGGGAGAAPPARGSFAVFADTLALFTEVPLQVGEQAVTAVMLVLALGALTLFLKYAVGKVGLAETERRQMEQHVGALLAEAEVCDENHS